MKLRWLACCLSFCRAGPTLSGAGTRENQGFSEELGHKPWAHSVPGLLHGAARGSTLDNELSPL